MLRRSFVSQWISCLSKEKAGVLVDSKIFSVAGDIPASTPGADWAISLLDIN